MPSFEEIHVGQTATESKLVTPELVELFAQVTGDTNPIHLDQEYASGTVFKERIAHGMLTAGFISAVLGCKLPGNGAVYLSQQIQFLRPVKMGDELVIHVEVKTKDEAKRMLTLRTWVVNQASKIVSDGEAVCKVL